jgi:hypothetical protein
VEPPASQVAAPPPAHAAVLAVVQKLDSQLHVQGYVNFSEFSLMDEVQKRRVSVICSAAFHIRNVLNADRDTAIISVRTRLRNNLTTFLLSIFFKFKSLYYYLNLFKANSVSSKTNFVDTVQNVFLSKSKVSEPVYKVLNFCRIHGARIWIRIRIANAEPS